MVFDASQDSGIMQDTRYMCRWSMRTDGLMANGAPFELHQTGMLAAEFAEDGAKLRHVELTTDVMSFMQQLRRSTGRDVFQVKCNVLCSSFVSLFLCFLFRRKVYSGALQQFTQPIFIYLSRIVS